MLRWTHLLFGIVGVLVFLGTGLYLRINYDMESLDAGPRILLRSRHAYILLASLVNLALGIHAPAPATRGRRALGTLGSLLVLAAPPLLVIGFFRDATRGKMLAPLVPLTIIALLAGILLYAVAFVRGRRRTVRNTCAPATSAIPPE